MFNDCENKEEREREIIVMTGIFVGASTRKKKSFSQKKGERIFASSQLWDKALGRILLTVGKEWERKGERERERERAYFLRVALLKTYAQSSLVCNA